MSWKACVTLIVLAFLVVSGGSALGHHRESHGGGKPAPTASPSPEPTPSPTPGTVDLAVSVADSPDPYLAAEDQLDGTTDGITYVVSVTNLGTATANAVGVLVGWGDGRLGLREVRPAQGSCGPVTPGGAGLAAMDCALGSVVAGQTVQVTLEMTVCVDDQSAFVDAFVAHGSDTNIENDYEGEETTAVGGTQLGCG